MHKSNPYMIAVLVLVSLSVGVTWLTVGAKTQGTIRTLEKIHLKDEPVEIVETKVGTKRVSLSQGFMADNDWVSNLSIKVKNLSEKQIVRIELELEFPEVTRNGDVVLLPMRYGQLPGVEDSGPKEEGLVGPNESVEIAVGGDTYGGVKNILTDGGRNPGLVTKARVQFAMIIFADGTAWRLGFNLIRDPKDPRHYIRVRNDIGRTKTPSRMGFLVSIPQRRSSVANFTVANFRVANFTVANLTRANSSLTPSLLMPACNAIFLGSYWKSCGREYCSTNGEEPGTSCNSVIEDDWAESEPGPPVPADVYGTYSAYSLCLKNGCPCTPAPGYLKRSLPCNPSYSPILIDVLGDGFNLTNAVNDVDFNFFGAGMLHLSWTAAGSDDAFLVLDRDGNGAIDSGYELFGNVTEQPSSTQQNGFNALAEYDKAANGGNNDGKIMQSDGIFSSLRLWQDSNHTGVSEPAELHTLPNLGLRTLYLDYKISRRVDENGNEFRYRAKVKDKHDAQMGRWAWDVFLTTN